MADEEQWQHWADAMNAAFCSNDTAAIAEFLSDDWVMVEGTQGIVRKENLLKSIREGRLLHTQMQKEIVQTKLLGDSVLFISKGKNIGSYNGQPFDSEFLVSHLLQKTGNRWQCVFTQETPVSSWPEPDSNNCV